MKDSQFAFDYVHLLYQKSHEVNSNRGESYGSPDCIKSKKKTKINYINKKYNKCFQYAATVALITEGIGKNPVRITKIKLSINKYSNKFSIRKR